MKHLDLFSGIGGFALATEMVWDDVEHIFCDNDPFAQAVLKKHWPNSIIYGDIKTLTAERIASDTPSWRERVCEQKGIGAREPEVQIRDGDRVAIDLLTGGFPCQPFSAAGRRLGTEDDRHLWPEMLRVIRETNPTYVLGENVGGFLTWNGGMVFQQVCTDLEAEGYEVCPLVIPACAVNAPHRRDRVWIAAFNPKHARQYGSQDTESRTKGSDSDATRTHQDEQPTRPAMARNDAANRIKSGLEGKASGIEGREERVGHDGDSVRTRPQSSRRASWNENWPEVAARLCTLDDGLPGGLARPKGWRNAALKGAGNAIVPQVAAEILRAMKQISPLET